MGRAHARDIANYRSGPERTAVKIKGTTADQDNSKSCLVRCGSYIISLPYTDSDLYNNNDYL